MDIPLAGEAATGELRWPCDRLLDGSAAFTAFNGGIGLESGDIPPATSLSTLGPSSSSVYVLNTLMCSERDLYHAHCQCELNDERPCCIFTSYV